MIFGKKKSTEKEIKTRQKIDKLSEEIAEIWQSTNNAKLFDANGSYTGNPEGFDIPVQDADDL